MVTAFFNKATNKIVCCLIRHSYQITTLFCGTVTSIQLSSMAQFLYNSCHLQHSYLITTVFYSTVTKIQLSFWHSYLFKLSYMHLNCLTWHSYRFKLSYTAWLLIYTALYSAVTHITCLIQCNYWYNLPCTSQFWYNLPYTAQLLI